MPHEVTMPQLGMAQDAGRIVAWLKNPGDPVSKGDALFEVETDKATMEVEAQADGFLGGITASEGDDVPVGQVIARIFDTADAAEEVGEGDTGAAAPAAEGEDESLPDGAQVTMPQLGMAQDSGLLVSWQKAPGDAVAADDVLFEVETDKSTMEVPAGADGYLAATLAQAGEEVPVGDLVAIISAEKPDAPVTRSVSQAAAGQRAEPPAEPEPPARPQRTAQEPRKTTTPDPGGRILASPKARRLAAEQGLDLRLLAEAGHPQPYHVRDLEALRDLATKVPAQAAGQAQRLTAAISQDGLPEFAEWAAGQHGLSDRDALLAGLAGASLSAGAPVVIGIEGVGRIQSYAVPRNRALSRVAQTEDAPDLILRDLRGTSLRAVEMGAGDVPVLTLVTEGQGLSITLECSPAQLDAAGAIALLTDFAGRMEQPLRHLL
ncbi:pyruvate dehydrogenase E2 component (dihydrolipoamide acetyltransferase)/2-oxoglutarate dehydrogenase E2 component (dihydrolipoamide succinyltransferase) [Cribrihabitans marinus]|uniref:Pyruvate dehydrogenase E2 component (Dihydrolipoamide acetyltransferase)/2-oxoglutarate dehydrogenase E2 component (Dihydrolipoamide succinyltransferase) n=1 Tax=Cribrihabitans marinus TaxID=1227549 RepID=A0A1H7BF48_9RHOB|nr:biotin/lipoyl-containing protein [Cribrihabitans marinus]GGH33109.1 hypothetical protein GCM10010973_24990 [Cribrihabitans marinus]SEJ72055.1 pyruvate dehydrogenase E2 component (dihydrolipoamide acetyltransferase)/2-oxoglutarate dehydrogenase E2 component (dihydrolipoamide succinyltransferase) [Cribrihabitans marinus]